ncbi:hypothetical protein [Agrobacterium vitis]|uniref:hypothetical protein n=1 Tax=Agrobacterium vitis TaxID=373 RepID=UPI0015D8FE3A|nr:hypothetical protein [Agrobacterium vitis]
MASKTGPEIASCQNPELAKPMGSASQLQRSRHYRRDRLTVDKTGRRDMIFQVIPGFAFTGEG